MGVEPGAEQRGRRGGTDSTCATVPVKALELPNAAHGKCKTQALSLTPLCPKSAGYIGQDGRLKLGQHRLLGDAWWLLVVGIILGCPQSLF